MANQKTPGQRITALREHRFMTKRDLASRLDISESKLSRIESGKTATLDAQVLVRLAQVFHVSADYILGLSPVADSKSHDLAQLHLTEQAVEKLVKGEVNGEILSAMMEHPDFGHLMQLACAYFEDIYAEGVQARNHVLDIGASLLKNHAADYDGATEVNIAAANVAQAKTGPHEIELTAIRSLYIKILKETKQRIQRQQMEADPACRRKAANSAFLEKLRTASEEIYQTEATPEEKLDLLTDRMLFEIGQQTGLKGWALNLLRPVYKRILRNTGKQDVEAQEPTED